MESLLLDAIDDGSLGTLKVNTFPVEPTISGVYKLSTTVIWSAPNESWVCHLGICTKNELSLWWTNISARVSNSFVMFLHGVCAPKSALLLSTDSQVLTERALCLVEDNVIFKNSLKFCPIFISDNQ